MKKSTGSILLLSAFAAMVLAGCGKEGDSSSTPATGSSETAVQTSVDEASAPGTSEGGATGTSTTTGSTSSPAASSSTPAVTDWSQMDFIGQYKGGMQSLVINSDKTTSWGTSTDKFPATYTDLGGGLSKIVSTSAVDDENYVEIITDGDMAYILHNKDDMDYYVMDKSAPGGAAIAFAETEDEGNFFGGIEVSSGRWKYFACIDGTYHFNVTITIQAGTNINAGGAIFDYGTGANKSSWKVTDPAPTATGFATIEQTNFTATDYTAAPGTDGHGTLTVGIDNDGLVFATLNGVELVGATLSADGKVISVPKSGAPVTYDTTDPAGPMKVTQTTTYTLSTIAQTYTESEGSIKTPLFGTISGASGSYNAETDASGSIWVVYVADESGILALEETVKNIHDSYIAVYDASTGEYTNTDKAIAKDDNMFDEVSTSLTVIAGHTYVIKLGSYADREKTYTYTSSTFSDCEEEFAWVFTAFTHNVYTGEAGEVDLLMSGTELVAVTIAGEECSSFEKNGSALSTVSRSTDLSNPSDIVITTTTRTFTLNDTDGTYTLESTPVDSHPFHPLAATDTEYSATTGTDGNAWCSFTPSKNGMITVEATDPDNEYTYIYLSVFEFDPATGTDALVSTGANRIGYGTGYDATVSVSVQAGATYIIKAAVYATNDLTIGDTAAAGNINQPRDFTFSYVDYIMKTFTGAEGDLVIATKDGRYMNASLDGTPIAGKADYDMTNGVFALVGTQTLDMTDTNDPVLTSTDVVYTLDYATHTYAKTTEAVTRHVFNELTDDSTGLSGYIGEDGFLWATFTPTTDGLLTIEETIQASSGSANDTVLQIYEKTATSTLASFKGTTGCLNYTFQYSGYDNGTAPVYVRKMPVTGGHTYIIKIGCYWGYSNTVGDQLSSSYSGYVGSAEAFDFQFDAIITNTYTADGKDNIETKTINGQLYKATIGTKDVTKNATISEDGKTLTVKDTNPTVNAASKLDPIATYNNAVYYLDNESHTYETDAETVNVHLFQTVNETDTSITGTVGPDGNLWGVFTPSADGYITIEETECTATDGILQLFESTASDFVSANAKEKAEYGAKLSGCGKLTDIPVEAGKTYVIKGGASVDKDKVPGGSTTSTYAGKTETISFSYTGNTEIRYTGAEGDLVKKYLGERYMGVTLDGKTFTATPNEDKSVYTSVLGAFESGTFVINTKTYTLGEGTYEVQAESEATQVTLADSWTGANSGAYETLANGAIIIAFTPETTGSYTFTLDAVAGADTKLGIFADEFNATGFAGSALTYSDKGNGQAETFTYTCEAGKTYYIKASAYWSDFNKAITNMSAEAARVGVPLTVTVA